MGIVSGLGTKPHHRATMMYRSQAQDAIADNQSYLDDPRLDAITDKVIQFLADTPTTEWETFHWALFSRMWSDRKLKKRFDTQEAVKSQTTEALRDLMNDGS
jgi:hypothetical protein